MPVKFFDKVPRLAMNQANMPLHATEAPVTAASANLVSGDLHSPPVLNPLSLNDRADDILLVMQTFTWVDSHEKEKMAGEELCPEHKKLISRWNGRCSGTMKANAMQQTETALIVRLKFKYLHISIHFFSKGSFRFFPQSLNPNPRTRRPWFFRNPRPC
jgi:hypothetical protein